MTLGTYITSRPNQQTGLIWILNNNNKNKRLEQKKEKERLKGSSRTTEENWSCNTRHGQWWKRLKWCKCYIFHIDVDGRLSKKAFEMGQAVSEP